MEVEEERIQAFKKYLKDWEQEFKNKAKSCVSTRAYGNFNQKAEILYYVYQRFDMILDKTKEISLIQDLMKSDIEEIGTVIH